MKVVVIGAGPAGVAAALRAAELGASTTLVTRDAFGGMAAHDGPVPVRTLAHAARLLDQARRADRYGIGLGEPRLDYPALVARARAIADEVARRSAWRAQVDALGIAVHERVGSVRFLDPHRLAAANGLRFEADRVILCAGGTSRRLAVPGAELTVTHSDAWSLDYVPSSLLVIGGGMTGLQVAWIFHAFGCRVRLMERGRHILRGEDADVARVVATGLRNAGIEIDEGFDSIESFERVAGEVRTHFVRDGRAGSVDTSLALTAIGWEADTRGLALDAAGIERDGRGFVRVDDSLATSVDGVFAAGDVTGRSHLVPSAVLDGRVAAENAVRGTRVESPRAQAATPMGGYTDPEYARLGMTEAEARADHEVAVGVVSFDEAARAIIDGNTFGFCKLVADRATRRILGCHVVGERAAEIVQAVALAVAGGSTVDALARMPLAFPTYVGMLSRAAFRAAREIDPALVEASPRDDL